jgi:hypothetical protein
MICIYSHKRAIEIAQIDKPMDTDLLATELLIETGEIFHVAGCVSIINLQTRQFRIWNPACSGFLEYTINRVGRIYSEQTNFQDALERKETYR